MMKASQLAANFEAFEKLLKSVKTKSLKLSRRTASSICQRNGIRLVQIVLIVLRSKSDQRFEIIESKTDIVDIHKTVLLKF